MSSTGDKIASHAKSAIGKKYKWGAKGPNEFDCSGLAIWCHGEVGIIISGDSLTLSNCGTDVSNNLQPGDLVFYATNDSSNNVSHVGVYIGNNKMVHAIVNEDNLNCSICYGILRDPIECIHCTINYCRECVNKTKDSNKKKNLPDLCPLCKKEWKLKENTIFRDFLTKQIKSFCSICKKPYINLEDHKPKCKEYKCKVCEKKFYTDDFMRHLMNSHKQIVLNLSNSNFKGDPFPKKKNKEPINNEFLSNVIGIEKNKANYIEGEYINLFRPNNEIPLPNENISIPSYLFLASNNLYYCGKKTNLNCGCCNGTCKIGNCLCKRCMEFNKELKYLKPYYLINKYARAAKYGFGSFWCMGEYINYSEVNGIKMKKCIQCMHPNNPCPGCQTLNKLYKEYLSPEVYEKFS